MDYKLIALLNAQLVINTLGFDRDDDKKIIMVHYNKAVQSLVDSDILVEAYFTSYGKIKFAELKINMPESMPREHSLLAVSDEYVYDEDYYYYHKGLEKNIKCKSLARYNNMMIIKDRYGIYLEVNVSDYIIDNTNKNLNLIEEL